MEQILYLTEKLKEYYLQDFQRLLNYCDSDFWDIDEGIKESLILINSNPNIQTLYSKIFTHRDDSISLETTSYLEITYTKHIESKLLAVLEEIKSAFLSRNLEVTLNKLEPADNSNYNPKTRIQLACVTDQDYFRITHVRIEIDSNGVKDHDLFWSKLTSKLPPLTE